MSFKVVMQLLAWAFLLLLVLFTLGPIQDRPRLTEDPDIERFLAFAATGLLFGLAYPTKRVLAGVGLVLAAALLEFGQRFAPHRDPHLIDATFKAAGGLCGVGLAAAAGFLFNWKTERA